MGKIVQTEALPSTAISEPVHFTPSSLPPGWWPIPGKLLSRVAPDRPAPSPSMGMGLMNTTIFVGLDVHKATVVVAVAEGLRGGEVRQLGTFPNRADQIAKLAEKLAKGGRRLSFCYEAGPCGYGLYRQLTGLGHDCIVVAPSLIPVKAGDGSRRTAATLRCWPNCPGWRIDGGLGSRCGPRGDARSGEGARDGGACARQGASASARFLAAAWACLCRQERLDTGLPALAGHGAFRSPRSADCAARLYPCRRRCREAR